MIITGLQAAKDKTGKIKVFIDGEYCFALNLEEMEQHMLYEGQEIDEDLYRHILDETVFPKARDKALAILSRSDKTEYELRNKLKQDGFTDDIIVRVMDYLKSYGYINDERYAQAYIYANKQKKSKLAIKTWLMQKGIASELADSLIDREYRDDISDGSDYELEAIKRALAKKVSSLESLDDKQKQKLIASLYRKGFELAKIKRVIKNDDF